MPTLPMNHPEPLAATLGVMHYPGAEGNDRAHAAAFAAQFVAAAVKSQGGTIDDMTAARLFRDAGVPLGEWETRAREGQAVGEVVKVLLALWLRDQQYASWEKAMKIVREHAAPRTGGGSRSRLMELKGRYLAVAHLWAAWQLREGRFTTDTEVGYDGYADFEAFIAESEIIRKWGQALGPLSFIDSGEEKTIDPPDQPFFTGDMWKPPTDWRPCERQPHWPLTGVIPVITLPEKMLGGLRRAGRPRKSA